jgi:hypothetical protein
MNSVLQLDTLEVQFLRKLVKLFLIALISVFLLSAAARSDSYLNLSSQKAPDRLRRSLKQHSLRFWRPTKSFPTMFSLVLALAGLYVLYRFYCFFTPSLGSRTGESGSLGEANIMAARVSTLQTRRSPILYCETCFSNKDVDSSGWCQRCNRTFLLSLHMLIALHRLRHKYNSCAWIRLEPCFVWDGLDAGKQRWFTPCDLYLWSRKRRRWIKLKNMVR